MEDAQAAVYQKLNCHFVLNSGTYGSYYGNKSWKCNKRASMSSPINAMIAQHTVSHVKIKQNNFFGCQEWVSATLNRQQKSLKSA
jgi:hypothetical protein